MKKLLKHVGGQSFFIRSRFLIAEYVAIGFCLNQILWVWSFLSIGRTDVNGLPNWLVPTELVLLSAIPIFVLANLSLLTCFAWFEKHPGLLVVSFLVLEILSQIFGRSLIKALFTGLMFSIILSRLSFDKEYALEEVQLCEMESLKVIHSEVLGLLRVSVTACTFVLGIIGVSFAANFLHQYYGGAHTQFKMWWYGSMVSYVGLGMFLLVIANIAKRLKGVRQLIMAREQSANG